MSTVILTIKEYLILMTMPITFIVGRRYEWSRKLCDATGNILWKD